MRRALYFFLLAFSTLAGAEDFTIQTFAGGGLPQNIQGTSAVLHGPSGIATDSNGNAFFTVTGQNIVLKLDPNGALTLVAGNGTPGFSGDGGLATNAQLTSPMGIALDGAGSLYIADYGNARIRKVQNGIISTIGGGGTQTADDVSATGALVAAEYVAVDAAANVYVEDPIPGLNATPVCCRIRKISNGTITTIAGDGTYGYSGDGGPATSAQLAGPGAMAVDAAGTLYFTDNGPPRPFAPRCFCNLRKIQNGVITTVVANVALSAITVDPGGNLFFVQGALIEKMSGGLITTIAGTHLSIPPPSTSIGENGPATDAYLGSVGGLSVDKNGNLFLTSSVVSEVPLASDLVRKISKGMITTVAGSVDGSYISIGDGGLPTGAQLSLNGGSGVAMDTSGYVYVAEFNRVREIVPGLITTVAGTGMAGFSGDNGPAADAQLNNPQGIGVDAAGNLYIADTNNLRVRKVSNGIITTIAGNGVEGYSGDGGPATNAGVWPQGLAVSPAGDVYVSESYNGVAVVRKISNGVIVTVAGNGTIGYSGDGGPATQAQLAQPSGLALDEAANLYIADTGNQVIRKVSNGVITTVAGSFGSAPGSSGGDGGPATNAQLNFPDAVAVDPLGRLYIGEGPSSQTNAHVRRVSNGVITTAAGNGTFGFSGDGGPAVSASLSPVGLAIGPNGQVYEADLLSSRVRVLTPVPVPGVSFIANYTPNSFIAGSNLFGENISWSAPGYTSLQIFANGALFDDVGTSGFVATGIWVGNGIMNFSLVDPATRSPLSTTTVFPVAKSGYPVTFTANPNPIILTAGANVGKTTLSWEAPPLNVVGGYTNTLQIWVAGVPFAFDLPTTGTIDTGNWVSDGLPFSLIDPNSGRTIASLTAHTKAPATTGQVTFTASPNPITLAAGTSVGKTTLSWNAPGNNGLQIWVNGTLFDAGMPASGSADTGNWVSDGTSFTLVNPTSGQTLATVNVAAK